jgi:hypothetical protein
VGRRGETVPWLRHRLARITDLWLNGGRGNRAEKAQSAYPAFIEVDDRIVTPEELTGGLLRRAVKTAWTGSDVERYLDLRRMPMAFRRKGGAKPITYWTCCAGRSCVSTRPPTMMGQPDP